MANAAQRQRKLAAKAARRKEVVAEKKKQEIASTSLPARVAVASKGTIVRCTMPMNLFEIGMGAICVARALPSGQVGVAFFLLDVFCLGVKNTFYEEMGRHELNERLETADVNDVFTEIEPAKARKLIRDAAAYAADLGLPAHKDTPVLEAIFGDVDASACTETFTFGKDGKPFYINGPDDTPAKIRAITQALEKCRGEGK